MKLLGAILALALFISAVVPAVAASPGVDKRARTLARDAGREARLVGRQVDRKDKANDVRLDTVERDIQVTNGRISTLPDTFNDNRVHESRATGVVGLERAAVSAACPDDRAIVSGGYEFSTNQGITTPQPQVVGQRVVGNAWQVTVNNGNGSVPVDLEVFAYCIPR